MNDEWGTPEYIIEAVRDVMGWIDLDPASNEIAQQRVKATTWYGKADDGLHKEWYGNVFLNPPYSRGLIGAFIDKLILEWHARRVGTAVVLTNCCPDTAWGARLIGEANAVCFLSKRVAFLDSDKKPVRGNPRGQMVSLFGGPVVVLSHAFLPFGHVMIRF